VFVKSWYEIKHPRATSSIYATLREQIKASIIAGHLDPGRLTELQVDSIVLFARSLLPVKGRIELIKSQHDSDDVGEFISHLKILIKDSAKKPQTMNERQKGQRDLCSDLSEPTVCITNLYSISP